ncbi:MAG: xanthine dehydrogenase family protein subunit M [Candidatus Rifleibacteriota bacterium]
MSNIKFLKPKSISEACKMLADEKDSMIIAGGTDLIVKLRNGLFPELKAFVDISSLPLNEIRQDNGNLIIGSGCTMNMIVENPVISKNFPALCKAARTVGALQIRNSATIGGNIANASPAGDTIPALMSLGAKIKIAGPDSSREVSIDDFFVGPGKTVLKNGELIESFIIPIKETRGEFLKLGERRAHAISKINLALSIWKETDNKYHCRIAMGSVGPKVIRVTEAEKFIEKTKFPLSDADLEKVADMAREAATPIDDVRSSKAYRKQMAGVLIKRAIKAVK